MNNVYKNPNVGPHLFPHGSPLFMQICFCHSCKSKYLRVVNKRL